MSWWMSFSGGDGGKPDGAKGELMTKKVTVDLNVFCSFVEDIIVGNLNGTLTVTTDDSRFGMLDPHVF